MSPERLLKEPWRLALFFTAMFGMLIVCLSIILWQQQLANVRTSASIARMRDLEEKSDRNNRTIWAAIAQEIKSYEAGKTARADLESRIQREEKMNIAILFNQRWIRRHIFKLERRIR